MERYKPYDVVIASYSVSQAPSRPCPCPPWSTLMSRDPPRMAAGRFQSDVVSRQD